MKRVITATCLAATFAVGLAAQSTGTAGTAGTAAQDPQAAGGQRGGGPRTVTGCLRAGDTAGTFTLTDVVMPAAGTGGGGAAGGTTAGTPATGTPPATGATAGGQGAGQTMPPTSINLTPEASVDLKAHVGHKIEVTGTLAGGRRGGAGGAGTGSTGTATGTTATGGTATGTTPTGGTATGTGTGSTSGTGTAGATGTGQGGGRGPRNMTVTSVRMISESCS